MRSRKITVMSITLRAHFSYTRLSESRDQTFLNIQWSLVPNLFFFSYLFWSTEITHNLNWLFHACINNFSGAYNRC